MQDYVSEDRLILMELEDDGQYSVIVNHPDMRFTVREHMNVVDAAALTVALKCVIRDVINEASGRAG